MAYAAPLWVTAIHVPNMAMGGRWRACLRSCGRLQQSRRAVLAENY